MIQYRAFTENSHTPTPTKILTLKWSHVHTNIQTYKDKTGQDKGTRQDKTREQDKWGQDKC